MIHTIATLCAISTCICYRHFGTEAILGPRERTWLLSLLAQLVL